MIDYILETRNLSKTFKKCTVVDNVEMKIPNNSIYGLLGPNGAGKSTTLKMLTGIMCPTNGQIIYKGQIWNRNHLNEIGALIESPALYENLTAKENLLVRSTLLNLPKSRINEVLSLVGLININNKKTGLFSTGMKQRLGIALALLNDPKLLILDEPTNGLDPIGIQDLRELIRYFPYMGITVILSSHMLSEVQQIANHIGIISNGKLEYQDNIDDKEDLEDLFIKIVSKNKKGDE